MESVTMATILTTVGSVITQVLAWGGEVITMITGQPLLMLFCVAIPLCGIGVGIVRRLIHVRG